MKSKLLADYKQAIEQTRRFHEEPGEWLRFEDDGEQLVWCHPDDRQAFLDAGVLEESIVHLSRPEEELLG